MRNRLCGIFARQNLVISPHASLPLFHAGDNSKRLHKTRAAKLTVDNDRQVMRRLLGDSSPIASSCALFKSTSLVLPWP